MSYGGMGSGCGSCATVDDAFGGGMSNIWGSNQTASLANSVLPGSVAMTPQQTDFLAPPAINNNPAVMSNAYNAGAAQAAMSNMVKSVNPQVVASAVQAPAVNAVAQAKKVETFVNQNGQVVTVTTPGANQSNTGTNQASNANTNGTTHGVNNKLVPKDLRVFLINLGFLMVAALAVNEAVKYYVNKSLQTAEANVPYYLIYAVVAVLVLVAAVFISKQYF